MRPSSASDRRARRERGHAANTARNAGGLLGCHSAHGSLRVPWKGFRFFFHHFSPDGSQLCLSACRVFFSRRAASRSPTATRKPSIRRPRHPRRDVHLARTHPSPRPSRRHLTRRLGRGARFASSRSSRWDRETASPLRRGRAPRLASRASSIKTNTLLDRPRPRPRPRVSSRPRSPLALRLLALRLRRPRLTSLSTAEPTCRPPWPVPSPCVPPRRRRVAASPVSPHRCATRAPALPPTYRPIPFPVP